MPTASKRRAAKRPVHERQPGQQPAEGHDQQTTAEEIQRRLAFLASAGAMLATSLDYEVTLANVTTLVVPELADSCVIHTETEDGSIRPLAFAHRDPQKVELIGSILERYPIDPTARAGIGQVMRTGQSQIFAEVDDALLALVARDEEHLQLLKQHSLRSVMVVPLAARGRVLGAISFFITESQRRYSPPDLALAEDLAYRCALAVDNARLYREAQEAIRLRDEFLSIAAHELRTPLASLLGYTELLQRRVERLAVLPEREEQTLRSLVVQTTRLCKMVDSLLSLSRLQGGQLALERAPLDLRRLVERIVDEVRPMLDQHVLTLDGDAQVLIDGDELRLEQLIQNLVSNAIKYSPGGGAIRVSVAERNGRACISVSDEGIGIPAGAQERIFERFYRAENADHGAIRGMGLGLSVVKEIVTLHGGEIAVTSQEQVGTTFTICLPLKRPTSNGRLTLDRGAGSA